ncbi:MAG: acylphosphatase, partial [bacterium]
FGIKGYAKNLVNGNVEVLAEGEQHLIFDYVKELKIGPSDSKVTSMIVDEFPFENEFREFKIY